MSSDKHWCVSNYFVFMGVGYGFVVNGKRHMTDQIYDVIVMPRFLR